MRTWSYRGGSYSSPTAQSFAIYITPQPPFFFFSLLFLCSRFLKDLLLLYISTKISICLLLTRIQSLAFEIVFSLAPWAVMLASGILFVLFITLD